MQTVPWYRAIVFRGGAVYFVVLAGLQVGIWVAYDQLDDGQEATLALMESTMYALTFLIVACMVVIYGRRAAFVSSGSVAGLSMRQRTKWRILVQVIVATIALTTRALVNLVACVASGLDWTGEPVRAAYYLNCMRATFFAVVRNFSTSQPYFSACWCTYTTSTFCSNVPPPHSVCATTCTRVTLQ